MIAITTRSSIKVKPRGRCCMDGTLPVRRAATFAAAKRQRWVHRTPEDLLRGIGGRGAYLDVGSVALPPLTPRWACRRLPPRPGSNAGWRSGEPAFPSRKLRASCCGRDLALL